MLHNSKNNQTKSKTPIKYTPPMSSPIRAKKQSSRLQNQTQIKNNNPKIDLKLRTKQKLAVINSLEQIYSRLNFNEFDSFSMSSIDNARKNIQHLYYFLKQQPICFKHQNLLNLYCENDKEVVCVSCVHKNQKQHKTHRIRSIDDVEKLLEYQAIRSQQKGKGLSHQLSQIKSQMEKLQRQVSQCYKQISIDTLTIINEAINDLQLIKSQLENYLGVAYRRTVAILNSYEKCVEKMTSLIDYNLQKSTVLSKLSKYLLLKQLNKESALMEDLVYRFNENKNIMEQWSKSNKQFQKIVVKKKSNMGYKQDVYVVTQF